MNFYYYGVQFRIMDDNSLELKKVQKDLLDADEVAHLKPTPGVSSVTYMTAGTPFGNFRVVTFISDEDFTDADAEAYVRKFLIT